MSYKSKREIDPEAHQSIMIIFPVQPSEMEKWKCGGEKMEHSISKANLGSHNQLKKKKRKKKPPRKLSGNIASST